VRASSLLRQLAKGGCAARRLSWVTPGFSQSRRCKTTASAKLACLQVDSRGSPKEGAQALSAKAQNLEKLSDTTNSKSFVVSNEKNLIKELELEKAKALTLEEFIELLRDKFGNK
jgi:hypothetical protein